MNSKAEASIEWCEAYRTWELPQLGSVAESDVLSKLLYMLAAQQGDLLNLSNLARSLGVSQPTVRRYVELLERSYLLRLLRPCHVNIKKRLVKSPKAYIRDTGLLHSLLGIETFEQLQRHPRVGASYETYVLEQLIGSATPRTDVFFYRTQAGSEMDLVFRKRDGRINCVEVKLSAALSLQKGFYNAQRDLGPEQTVVIAPVERAGERDQNVVIDNLEGVIGRLRNR